MSDMVSPLPNFIYLLDNRGLSNWKHIKWTVYEKGIPKVLLAKKMFEDAGV